MSKYVINTDKLELVLAGFKNESLINGSGFNISNSFKPSEKCGFLKCNNILYENQPFAQLYSVPSHRMRFRNREAVVLRLENESLYRAGTFQVVIPHFLDHVNLKIDYVRALDIAIDGAGIIKRHYQLHKKKNLKRKRHFKNGLNNTIDDVTMEQNRLYIGKYGSEKYVSLYNKTLELEASGKKYIRDFWKNNGLCETEQSIDRIELRLKTKELVGIEKSLVELDNPDYLASLFKTRTESHLTFIDKRTKKKHYVIDWTKFKTKEIKKEKKVVVEFANQNVKSCIKTLYLENLNYPNLVVANAARFLISKYNLQQWYLSREARWLSENPYYSEKPNSILLFSDSN